MIIKNLSKSFGKHTVLNELNYQFEEGKTYGIVGANGAGKTTLFQCIAGMTSYEGDIIFGNSSGAKDIAYLETDPFYFNYMTGIEYLEFICQARKYPFKKDQLINIFDLPLNEFASQYSTGMKKKLAIQGILLTPNQIFILDEPFNGVDINSNLLITEIIKKIKENNKTVLISSHIVATLTNICDKIILLQNGQLTKEYLPHEFTSLEGDLKNNQHHDVVNKLQIL